MHGMVTLPLAMVEMTEDLTWCYLLIFVIQCGGENRMYLLGIDADQVLLASGLHVEMEWYES